MCFSRTVRDDDCFSFYERNRRIGSGNRDRRRSPSNVVSSAGAGGERVLFADVRVLRFPKRPMRYLSRNVAAERFLNSDRPPIPSNIVRSRTSLLRVSGHRTRSVYRYRGRRPCFECSDVNLNIRLQLLSAE